MRLSLQSLALSLTLAIPGFCQLAAEHAAAVAGGGLGVVAGKPISGAIDKVFTSVEKAATRKAPDKRAPAKAAPKAKDDHAKNEQAKTEKTPGPPPAAPTVSSPGNGGVNSAATSTASSSPARSRTPSAKHSARVATRHPRAIQRTAPDVDQTEEAEPAAVRPASSPVEAIVHDADVSKVKEGMARGEVLALTGEPSARVTIPDEGHLLEVYRFTAGNRWLGTVRLDNGSVVKVEAPR